MPTPTPPPHDKPRQESVEGCTCKNLAPASVHFKDCPAIQPENIEEVLKMLDEKPLCGRRSECGEWHGLCPENVMAFVIKVKNEAYIAGRASMRSDILAVVPEEPLYKKNHSLTYNGDEENIVFDEEALQAAKNIKIDKRSYKEMYASMKNDKFYSDLLGKIGGIE